MRKVTQQVDCPSCKGTGVHHSEDFAGSGVGTNSACDRCGGTGKVDIKLALCEMTTVCLRCKGAGRGGNAGHGIGNPCWNCGGTGRVRLLDPDGKFGLRKECPPCRGGGSRDYTPALPLGGTCQRCQGHGWNPTEDKWV